jgi:hypothetical protein
MITSWMTDPFTIRELHYEILKLDCQMPDENLGPRAIDCPSSDTVWL